MKKPDEKITSTDVLIVGFGFSVIPLIRELERDGINFTIVSSRGSIWERLEQHNRLDFDLVSSMHSSLYSFELVNHDPSDRYPTAREFHVFIQKYLSLYRSRVIDDFVTLVENHASHSIVYTQSGRIFETKHLIVATAFRRKMNQLLNEFDYGSVKNQTIAFTGMGDSINLMISKLIPYNNRIVLITNPFFALDKLVFYDDVPYTLDQLEFHDIRHLSNMLYRKAITTGFELVVIFAKLLKLLSVDHIYLKHRLAYRWRNQITFKTFPRSPIPNGFMSIKFWPIDTYQNLFDNGSLPQAIQDGYLLNDIVFFLEQGLVELWPKSDTAIDREGKTIRWKDKIVAYDQIVEPDYEVPNLPDIIADHEGASKHKYQYVYKDNFMGVIPKDLRNIYFLGLTRPFTGGLNNIIEMQGLFVHKMITDPGYHREIHKNLEQRIRKYNNYYYYWDVRGKEHLVHYGFYTDDMARLMKINLRLRDCRSLRDLIIYFVFPNNAFKYRQSGRYEVPGVKDMMQKIYKNHLGYSIVVNYLLMYALLQLTAYVAVIVAYYRQELSGAAAALLFILVLLNPVTSFVAAYAFPRNSYLNPLMVAALVLTAFYPIPAIPIASMLLVFALTYVFRKLGWTRQFFNELRFKRKRKYKEFFKRYCDTFREVFFDTRSQTEQRDANRV